MKVRIMMTVDLREPGSWKRRDENSLTRRWITDTRPVNDILKDRLNLAVIGVEEYVGAVEDETIEVL